MLHWGEQAGRVGPTLLGLVEAVDQRSFVARAIDRTGQARDAYQIGRNRFVLIDLALKLALDVLKEKRKSLEEERRAFVRPKIKAWLARRPYYHVHFTPTSASWINLIERWFAELTRKQIQRGVHTSVRQLEADIRTFIDRHNKKPKPFKWTKSADQILASVKRFCHKAQQTLCGEL